ncbi:MAG: UDP-N-acetylglucosamine 2-epimerase (hydrolyzing) [Muribaculaceae bacterium]|nr:UDP-N-acetylglucosamine 2-epimerase (hydrolyzing) [Muribaculaceae bacterium]
MKKICFVTGTRADYGILAPVMHEIKGHPEAELQIVATNMHLSPQFGNTVEEIEKDGFQIDAKIPSLEPGDTAASTVRSMARVQEGLAGAFEKLQPDLVVILGDRYEALAAASAAVVFNIPIAHLHGGETTEGAIDDKFRHAITKLSTYHFAATPQYAGKIVEMGEKPENVFHSGAPGAEVEETPYDNLSPEFYVKTGIEPDEPYILLAIHPVTTLADKGKKDVEATLRALEAFISQGYRILATMPNSDPGNEMVTNLITDWAQKHRGTVVTVKSLGSRLFRHAMEHACAMVGNSSAALIEAPSCRLGAVNVGTRQKGRAHGLTVIDVPADIPGIIDAIDSVLSMEMRAVLMGVPVSGLNPYYKKDSARYIAEKLLEL